MSLYLTGLGRVDGSIAAGWAAPASPPLPVRLPVEARIGAAGVQPSFAGLLPGSVGVYRVDIDIPRALAGGTYSLRIVMKEASSNPATLIVR